MKKMRKMFYAMNIIGISTFMVMMFMMLFIDFRAIELAIPFIIGCVGHIGMRFVEIEMKRLRCRKIRTRKVMNGMGC